MDNQIIFGNYTFGNDTITFNAPANISSEAVKNLILGETQDSNEVTHEKYFGENINRAWQTITAKG